MSAAVEPRSPNPLFRTSSASSVSSVDTHLSLDDVAADGEPPRRTRKRFTSTQLMMLEHLYHQTSHPTREQREMLAKEAVIELRSVTVWFQNKRQTERKVALHSSVASLDDPTSSTAHPASVQSELGARSRRISNSSTPRAAPPSTSPGSSSSSARTLRPHLHHGRPQLRAAARRPSLDHVATRAERPQPRTPTRVRTYSAPGDDPRSLYEHMPSSPPSPLSPARNGDDTDRDRALRDFGLLRRCRSRPTLEWACAQARLSGRRDDDDDDAPMDVDELLPGAPHGEGDTEDEMDVPHEALTPSSSLGSQGALWKGHVGRTIHMGHLKPAAAPFDGAGVGAAPKPLVKTVSEQDVMEAALALCGLGGAGR